MSTEHSAEQDVLLHGLGVEDREALTLTMLAPDHDCAHNMVPLYAEVERIVAEHVRKALHDAWLAVHVRRFDDDYKGRGETPPEYARQALPDSIYRGIQLAERAIGEVAEQNGVGYHALRDLRLPPGTPAPGGGA